MFETKMWYFIFSILFLFFILKIDNIWYKMHVLHVETCISILKLVECSKNFFLWNIIYLLQQWNNWKF